MIHETRHHPDRRQPRPHLAEVHRASTWAIARGHWEGDTLVVETTNFRDAQRLPQRQPGHAAASPSASRASAPNKVRWSVTVDDPTTWTRPWTFSLPLTMNDDEPIMLYECHEGNYGLRNILSAARAEERAQ